MSKLCSVCNGSPVVARGWCNKHYQRYKKHGDPNATRFLRTTETVGSKEYFEECSRKSSGPLDTECWIWTKAIDAAGYGRFGKTSLYAHRQSYSLFVGAIPDGMLVCHTCDVRSCINPDHLFIGTYQENNDDMIEKGRDRKMRVLSDEDIVIIRRRAKAGERQGNIAKDFSISSSMVSAINTGRRRNK